MTVGAALAAAREAAGLSQSELSRRSGVAQPQISLYEADRRVPDTETLVRLARVLGASLDGLTAGMA